MCGVGRVSCDCSSKRCTGLSRRPLQGFCIESGKNKKEPHAIMQVAVNFVCVCVTTIQSLLESKLRIHSSHLVNGVGRLTL